MKAFFVVLAGLVFSAFLSVFLFTNYGGRILHGDWVDQTVGQILSKKYGDTVIVKNVKIVHWHDIHFQAMKVYSKDNQLLASAVTGRIYLKKLSLKKSTNFETEIDLSGVLLSKRYIENSKGIKPWIYLMRKPVQVKDLQINIVQGNGITTVHILKCHSDNIVFSGGMVLNEKGILKDNVLVSFSPFKMLWMMI